MSVQNWDALPADLKYVQQWCISAPDKSPYSTTGHRASVIDAMHWTDWYSASTIAASWGTGAGIGFVLTQDDEFTCIDLDVKDGTTEEELERYQKIIEAFDSYTERSTSGRGCSRRGLSLQAALLWSAARLPDWRRRRRARR